MADPRLFDLLHDSVSDVNEAKDLDGVLAVIQRYLGVEVDVWGLWLTATIPGPLVKILAFSAIMESFMEVGSTIPADYNEQALEYARILDGGSAIIHVNESRTMGLIDDLMLDAGVRRMAVLPFMEGGKVACTLTIMSAAPDKILTRHIPFFDGLCRGTEEHVAGLVKASGLLEETSV